MKNAETFIPRPMGGSHLVITTSAAKGSSPAQSSELRAQLRDSRPERARPRRARTRRRWSLSPRRFAYRPSRQRT
jgi:hypothetical protein